MPRDAQQQLKSLLQDGWSLEKELEGKGMIVLQGYDAMNNRFVGDVYTRGGINFPVSAGSVSAFIATAEAVLSLED